MDWRQLGEWANRPEIAAGLALTVILLAVMTVISTWQAARFRKRWNDALRGVNGKQLEEILYECLRRVSQTEETVREHRQRIESLQDQADGCLQRVGVVKFDAFDDIGGQQSFVVALLNEKGDGVAVSGLHSRQEMRVYAKTISSDRKDEFLSAEEAQAIKVAQRELVAATHG